MRNHIRSKVDSEHTSDFIVTSRLRGFFHLANSIRVEDLDMPCFLNEEFRTVTEFLLNYAPLEVLDQRRVAVPFLRHEVGLGDAIALFAERFPRFIKALFRGCLERRRWLNMTVLLEPTRRVRHQIVAQKIEDHAAMGDADWADRETAPAQELSPCAKAWLELLSRLR